MRAHKNHIPRGLITVRAEATAADVVPIIRELNAAFDTFKKKHTSELDELRAGMDSLALATAAGQMNGVGRRVATSLGAQATKSIEDNTAFLALREWNAGTCRLNVESQFKAALTNEKGSPGDGGTIPNNPDDHGFVAPVQRPLRLLDALPSRPTTRDSVKFVQMNATGDAAEQIHEGDEKSEVDFDGTLRTADIATIAGHTTASRQVLDDAPQLGGLIDRVLRGKVRSRLENQLVNGPGGQGRILGLVSQSTALVPTIGQTRADVIGEGLVRMADDGYSPNLVLLNPLDWFRIQITRKNADDDEYVFGSPTVPVPAALWNTSIVTTPSVAEGTSLVLDTSYTSVLDRQAVSVLISNSHKDYFTRNLILILAEMRAGLEVLDTLAVRKITLPAPAAP